MSFSESPLVGSETNELETMCPNCYGIYPRSLDTLLFSLCSLLRVLSSHFFVIPSLYTRCRYSHKIYVKWYLRKQTRASWGAQAANRGAKLFNKLQLEDYILASDSTQGDLAIRMAVGPIFIGLFSLI